MRFSRLGKSGCGQSRGAERGAGSGAGTLANRAEADAKSKKAIAIIQVLASVKDPPALYVIADTYCLAGELARAMALRSAADERRQHWMEARDWYQKSLDSWRQISNPGAVSPDGWPCGNSREVATAVAIRDRVLHSGNVSANATPVTVPSRQ